MANIKKDTKSAFGWVARSSPNKIRPLAMGKGVIWIAVMISLTLTHVPTSSFIFCPSLAYSWATKSNTKFWPGGSLAGLTHGSTQIDPNYKKTGSARV